MERGVKVVLEHAPAEVFQSTDSRAYLRDNGTPAAAGSQGAVIGEADLLAEADGGFQGHGDLLTVFDGELWGRATSAARLLGSISRELVRVDPEAMHHEGGPSVITWPKSGVARQLRVFGASLGIWVRGASGDEDGTSVTLGATRDGYSGGDRHEPACLPCFFTCCRACRLFDCAMQ